MDLRQVVRIWRARWILTSVLLILAMAGAASAAAKMPRYYQSASSVVLLASRVAARQNGGNPFLSFSPSLTLTADAVSRTLMAPGTVRQLAARGFTASYTVALPPYTTATTGSVLLVTVTGPGAAAVQRTLQAVTAQIGPQLAQLQLRCPGPRPGARRYALLHAAGDAQHQPDGAATGRRGRAAARDLSRDTDRRGWAGHPAAAQGSVGAPGLPGALSGPGAP